MKVALNMSESVDLGNNGITLEIRDGQGKHLGNLRIGRARAAWSKSKARTKSEGVKLEDLINFVIEAQEPAKTPPSATKARGTTGPKGRTTAKTTPSKASAAKGAGRRSSVAK